VSRAPRGLNAASSILSQGLNSGTNLAVAAFVAHSADPSEFGAWAVLLAGYGLALQISRALVVTPMLVHEQVAGRVPAWLSRQTCSAAFIVGLLGTVAVVGVTLLLPAALFETGLLVAAGMPLLLVQDVLRNQAIRNGRAWWAAVLDAVWVAVQGLLTAYLLASDHDSIALLTGAWALGGVVGGLGGLVAQRLLLSVRAARRFAVDNREASLKLLLESVLGNGVVLLLPAMLAVVSGFAVAGAVRAGQTLMGAITLLMGGLIPLITTASVLRARRGQGVGGVVVGVSAATVVVSGGLGLVAWQEQGLGRALAGNAWPLVLTILVPIVIVSGLRGPIAAVPAVMRAQRLFDGVVNLRLRCSVPAVAMPLAGSAIWGLSGAAWGMAGAAVVNTLQSARAYRLMRGSA
jgi:hypothetical protein